MMCPSENDDDAEPVASVTTIDPIRKILATAVAEAIETTLPDSYARKVMIEELMATEARIKARLIRRYVH